MSLEQESPMGETTPGVFGEPSQLRGDTKTDDPGRIHLILTPPEDSEETMKSKYKQWQARVESGYIPQKLKGAILMNMQNIATHIDSGRGEKVPPTVGQISAMTEDIITRIQEDFLRIAGDLQYFVNKYYKGEPAEKNSKISSIMKYRRVIQERDFFQISLGKEGEGFQELINSLFDFIDKEREIISKEEHDTFFVELWHMRSDLKILFGPNGGIRQCFFLLQEHLQEEQMLLEYALSDKIELKGGKKEEAKINSMLNRLNFLKDNLETLFGHEGYFVPILYKREFLARLLDFSRTNRK